MPIKKINSVPNFLFEKPKNRVLKRNNNGNDNNIKVKTGSVFNILYNLLNIKTK